MDRVSQTQQGYSASVANSSMDRARNNGCISSERAQAFSLHLGEVHLAP